LKALSHFPKRTE